MADARREGGPGSLRGGKRSVCASELGVAGVSGEAEVKQFCETLREGEIDETVG